MSETAATTHKLTYDNDRAIGWTCVTCTCGQRSEMWPRSKQGSRRLGDWVLEHATDVGELDMSGMT